MDWDGIRKGEMKALVNNLITHEFLKNMIIKFRSNNIINK